MSMMILSGYPLRFAAISLLILTIANWSLDPAKGVIWALVLVMAGIGGVLGVTLGRGESASARHIRASLFGASLVIAGALLISLGGQTGWLGDVAGDRLFGVMLGLVLVVTGNFLPKTVRPITQRHCGSVRLARFERRAGWIFVLAGLVHIAIWIFAPADSANPAAMMIVAAALCLIAALWLLTKGGGPAPSQHRTGSKS